MREKGTAPASRLTDEKTGVTRRRTERRPGLPLEISTVDARAAVTRRAAGGRGRGASAGRSLLQLQRRHGNRYARRLLAESGPGAGRVQRQVAEEATETSAAPKDLSVPERHTYVFYFVNPRDGGFGTSAKAYMDKFYSGDLYHQKRVRSFEELFVWLAADVAKRNAESEDGIRIDEIVIVTHANSQGMMKAPLVRGGGKKRDFSPWNLTELQEEVLGGKHRRLMRHRARVLEALDDDAQIVVRGCNLGQSQDAVDALGIFFGGRQAYAPKGLQGFVNFPIGRSSLHDKVAAFDFLVTQGHLPEEDGELSDAEKVAFMDQEYADKLVPAQFFVLPEHQEAYRALSTREKLGEAGEPYRRHDVEEEDPDVDVGVPSESAKARRYWTSSAREPGGPSGPITVSEEAVREPLGGLSGRDPTLPSPAQEPRPDLFLERRLTYQKPSQEKLEEGRRELEETARIVDEAARDREEPEPAGEEAPAAAEKPRRRGIRESAYRRAGQVEEIPGGVRLWNLTVASRNPRPEHHAALTRIAEKLIADPELEVRIRGHSSSSGSAKSNRRLSQRRAGAVAVFLANAGVPPQQIVEVKGYGEERLLEPEHGSRERRLEAMARNRRVEVTLEGGAKKKPPWMRTRPVREPGGERTRKEIEEIGEELTPETLYGDLGPALTISEVVAGFVAEVVTLALPVFEVLGPIISLAGLLVTIEETKDKEIKEARKRGLRFGMDSAAILIAMSGQRRVDFRDIRKRYHFTVVEEAYQSYGINYRFEIFWGIDTAAKLVNDTMGRTEKAFRLYLEEKKGLSPGEVERTYRQAIDEVRAEVVWILRDRVREELEGAK